MATIVLVVVTAVYVRRTARLAKSAAQQENAARSSLANQTIGELFREYRSYGFAVALKRLWDFYTVECKGDKELMIRRWVQLYHTEEDGPVKLHFVRRRVSQYYQHMTTLIDGQVIQPDVLYRVWKQGHLAIIPRILIPLETVAVPLALGNEPPSEMPTEFRRLQDLYDRAPKS